MPGQITEPSAGVDLVLVRKAAPASGAVPHRRHRSIIGDPGNASPRQAVNARQPLCMGGREVSSRLEATLPGAAVHRPEFGTPPISSPLTLREPPGK